MKTPTCFCAIKCPQVPSVQANEAAGQGARSNSVSLPNQFVWPLTGPSCRPEKIQLGLPAEGDAVTGRAHGGEEALPTRSAAVCLESQADVSYLRLSCSKRKQHLNSCRRVVIRCC